MHSPSAAAEREEPKCDFVSSLSVGTKHGIMLGGKNHRQQITLS